MVFVAEPASIRALVAKGGAVAGVLFAAACSSASQQDDGDISDEEKTALVNYIRGCWNASDVPLQRNFVVTIVMHMNRDATLQSAEITKSDRERLSDPAYAGYANAALRAVQKCGEDGKAFPINLERDYDIWSEIRARFKESDFY